MLVMRLIYWKICGTFAKKPAGFGTYQAWALSGLGLMKCGPNIEPWPAGLGRCPIELLWHKLLEHLLGRQLVAGNAHLNSEGGSICTLDLLVLTS